MSRRIEESFIMMFQRRAPSFVPVDLLIRLKSLHRYCTVELVNICTYWNYHLRSEAIRGGEDLCGFNEVPQCFRNDIKFLNQSLQFCTVSTLFSISFLDLPNMTDCKRKNESIEWELI